MAQSHPLDAGSLNIQIQDNRAIYNLKIHELALQKLIQSELNATSVFNNTLNTAALSLNHEVCEWRAPSADQLTKVESSYLQLSVVSVCTLARVKTESFELKLNFFKLMPEAFKLVVNIEGLTQDVSTFILDLHQPDLSINAKANQATGLFIKMGMAHIGADLAEWQEDGGLKWPDGIDHILFVFALVLASTTLIEVIKNATGFTMGHTLTLLLTTYGVIHVHSRWVEAFIALSIALLISISLFSRNNFKHGLWLNMAFGTVHGLGFSTVIHDLKLPNEMILPTVFSFNLGVEIGQIIIILLLAGFLFLMQKLKSQIIKPFKKYISFVILVLSLYWFVQRGVG